MARQDQTCETMFFYGPLADGSLPKRSWTNRGERRVDGFTLFTYASGKAAHARPAPGAYVLGSLYKVPEEEIPAMDSVEGHPYWYSRTPVITTNGEHCTMYVLADRIDEMPDGYVDIGPQWKPR
jgi:gamma-glutamylcyclotransferase (GGCT)/AIG2-like uncharacterized protein YtfP